MGCDKFIIKTWTEGNYWVTVRNIWEDLIWLLFCKEGYGCSFESHEILIHDPVSYVM